MMDIDRRTLFKVIGLTAAGSSLPGCEREVHNLVPYLLPDDHIIPGVATWYASTCQECEAGCGLLARVMEGRVKKLEGNPENPINQGKLCARGQAGLQSVYNPDRLQQPLKRKGNRGEGNWQAITWEEGISTWMAHLQLHRGSACLMTRPVSGSLATLFDKVMSHISGKVVILEDRDVHTLRTANTLSFGTKSLPYYDIAHADYILSFGTPFLEHWLSPVAHGVAFGEFRQGRTTIRGRFIQIEPRLSLTAANADRWIPLTPGSDGLLALGIGQVLIQDGLTRSSLPLPASLKEIFFSSSLEDIAIATDILSGTIRELAHELASAARPLILGGGPAGSQTNGTQTMMLISALNFLVGNINKTGGLQWNDSPDFSGQTTNLDTASDRFFSDWAENFSNGENHLLHLYRANPLFTLPPSTNIEHFFSQAQFIVSFSPFLDESTSMADLILPDHDFLESWGDQVWQDSSPRPGLNLLQPVIRPLYDTRAIGDVWLEAVRHFGEPLTAELPWTSFRDMMVATWLPFLQNHETADSPEESWYLALQHGGYWPTTAFQQSTNLLPQVMALETPNFFGDPADYPFYFYPYPSLALHDGRGANRPWLQELPDPLTTGMWGTWIEINPATANKLNIHHGDVARITSPFGDVEAQVVYFPGLRPDLLAMPIGQGHRTYGRYAKDRGCNPLTLLGPAFDSHSGSLATGATRVQIERVFGNSKLVLLDQSGQTQFLTRHQTGGL